MKRIFFALAIVFAASLRAQAPEPMPLAHGNVPGEPHHHLRIENEYVRVYYVEVPPHENTQLHQHDHDYLFVTLGDSDVMNAVLNKPEVRLKLIDGETHFTRGGFAHVARNRADTPFRNVTIELLKPQGEAHNDCGFVIPNEGAGWCDPPFVSVWYSTQFETAESKLDLVQFFWQKAVGKTAVSLAEHKANDPKLAFLVVGLNGPEVKINVKGKVPETLHAGEVKWFDAGSDVQLSSESNKVAQFLKLSFKDSSPSAKP